MTLAALRRAFFIAAAAWLVALFVAARISAASAHGPGGYLFSAAIYYIGALVCHQRPERSFHVWHAQLPVCARCLGIYAGFVAAFVAAYIAPYAVSAFRRTTAVSFSRTFGAVRLKADTTYGMMAAAAPAALTLVYEWTTGVMPSNAIRAATGVVLGWAVGRLVIRVR